MNISKILHDEMYRVARQVVTEKYNDPTAKDITLSLDEVITQGVCRSNIPKMFRRPEMIFDSQHPTYSQKLEANSFYSRVATLLEYNELKITIDNTLAFVIDCWNESKEKTGKGKLPPKYRNLWKYYIPLSNQVKTKEEKQDCMRYAFLRTIDENEQIMTFGVIWRPDVSFSKQYDNAMNKMTREERRVEKLRQEQLSRDNSPSWEVDNGKVRSAYVLAFSGEGE